MHISLLCPSRNRPQQVDGLIRSVFATASSPDQVEVLFRLDDDDPTLKDTVAVLDSYTHHPVRYIVGPRLRGYMDLPIFFNELAEIASGGLLGLTNDDIVFTTSWWDTTIRLCVDDPLVDAAVVSVTTGHHPFITRRLYELLGHFSHPQDNSCDCYLTHLGDALGIRHSVEKFYEELDLSDTTAREKVETNDWGSICYVGDWNAARRDSYEKVLAVLGRIQ